LAEVSSIVDTTGVEPKSIMPLSDPAEIAEIVRKIEKLERNGNYYGDDDSRAD